MSAPHDPTDALRRELAASPQRDDIALALANALRKQGAENEALALLATRTADRACADRLREAWLGERRDAELRGLLTRRAPAQDVSGWVDHAVRAHLAGDLRNAVTACQRAIALDPRHAPAYNHLGRALHNLGQTDAALRAFQQAVAVSEDYPEAWNNLGHALRARGQLQAACKCFERALTLAPGARTPRLNLGITLYAADQAEAALQAYQVLLERDPGDCEALTNAGLALHLLGRLEEALDHYRRALRKQPDDPTTLYYFGTLCSELGETEQARTALSRALALQPADVDAWAELAALEETANQLDAAERALQQGLKRAPRHPQLNLEAAKLDRRRGAPDQALARLRGLDVANLPSRFAQQYHYELGTVLDRLDQTDAAYTAFVQANTLAARSPRRAAIDDGAFFRHLEAMRRWRTSALQSPEADDRGEDLCFLIGFPRSGTTLLDTMLDAHPAIDSIEEKPTLERAITLARRFAGGYPDGLASLSAEQRIALRRCYREAVNEYLPDRRGRLVLDKLPLRTVDAAFIRFLFPGARVLFAQRHPCDVVLSNFMQQYAVNEAFVHFYTLADCVRMYDAVLGLWQEIAPLFAERLCYVSYEALVENAADELAKVCRFLDIEWHGDMLDTERRIARGPIRTNSYQQVAEPLYRRAIARWERYRTHLQPHLDTLRPHAQFLGYAWADDV